MAQLDPNHGKNQLLVQYMPVADSPIGTNDTTATTNTTASSTARTTTSSSRSSRSSSSSNSSNSSNSSETSSSSLSYRKEMFLPRFPPYFTIRLKHVRENEAVETCVDEED